MATINFKHLRYFWSVASSGSIARASEQLHVTPQSISSQLAELEDSLGAELFQRVGRTLVLSDTGRRIQGLAGEIFELEQELLSTVREQSRSVALPFSVGIADSVPKSLAYHVLEPAMRLEETVRLVCREGRLASLLADLSIHRLDLVIADRPMPPDIRVRAFSHLLGASDVTVFGAPSLLKRLDGAFPQVIDGAPFLLPGEEVVLRAALERWFESENIRPRVVAEFDDGALMKAFGQGGAGLFVAPTALTDYVERQYEVRAMGRIESVVERLYAITTERRVQHPAAVAVCQAAQQDVFGAGSVTASRTGKATRPTRRR